MCYTKRHDAKRRGKAMEENWKRGLRISWYLLGPLLLYACVNDAVILCWERFDLSTGNVPAPIPAAAASAFVLWLWYQKETSVHRQAKLSWGRCLWIIASASVSCVFLNHLLVFLRISSDGYDKVKDMVFELDLVWQIAGSGILVPLAEELVFRGMGYQRIRQEMNVLPASVITATLFALYHGNLIQGIYALLMGLLLAFVYETYDNLKAAWLFHATANLTAILITVK